jgi:subfamily B ATP-binding cassette protein MsbA
MRRLWGFTRPYAPLLAGALAVMALRAGLIAGVAYLVKPLFDEHLLRQHLAVVRFAPLLVLGFYALKTSLEYLQTYWLGVAGDGVCRDLRRALHRHLMDLPLPFFDRQPAAAIVARLVSDVTMIQSVVATSLLTTLKDAFSVVALGGLLVYQNWRMALMSVVVLPVAVYPLVRFGRFRRSRVRLEQEALADLSAVAHEGIAGNKIVKAFGMAAYEKRRFAERNERLYAMRRAVRHMVAASSPISEMVLAFAAAGIVAYGGHEVLAGHMTVGELASFFVALGLAYEPVKRISRGNLDLQAALGAFDRVVHILDEPVEPPRDDCPALVVRTGTVEFRHVHFAYDAQPVLVDVSFTAPPGATMALVGLSGAGKSTLMDLLAGFLEPTAGTILIDGQDLRGVSRSSLRARIGIVTQDVFLFNDTVRANIAYGSPAADDLAVARAAEMAEVHDVIERLPEGYATMIGERGGRFSGGERQRLAIARAFLKDAPILILDEATSALDTVTEARVQRSLERLMAGRTVFVIAHRLSTVQRADHIVVLAGGRIVEEGTHAALLARGGEYRRLYREQFEEPGAAAGGASEPVAAAAPEDAAPTGGLGKRVGTR